MASLKDKFTDAARGKRALGFDPLASDEPRLSTIRIEDIDIDPDQPRKDLGDLEGLKASIQSHGIMQPLIVSPLDESRYSIIAGERRFTAARQLGLRSVPALVRTVKDHSRIELQLIENLHRKDLDPFEEALGYQRLASEFNVTHEQIAQRIGKSRTHITQILALNELPHDIRMPGVQAGLSRETFFLIAKQETRERMHKVLQAALDGRPMEHQRNLARKGKARGGVRASLKKSQRVFSMNKKLHVIIQSLTDPLTLDQAIQALEQALEQARAERSTQLNQRK